MLIESKIKPTTKPTRTVECFGKRYEFKEQPRLAGRFIADVEDESAQKALLATGAYTEFTDKLPQSTLSAQATAAPAASAVATTPNSAATGTVTQSQADVAPTAPEPVDQAITEQAKLLLANSAPAIAKAVAPGPSAPAPALLTEALRIESSETKPRPRVVAALKNAIG